MEIALEALLQPAHLLLTVTPYAPTDAVCLHFPELTGHQ